MKYYIQIIILAAVCFYLTYSTGVKAEEVPASEATTIEAVTTEKVTTESETGEIQTEEPVTQEPTAEAPTTEAPTTEVPTTEEPTTKKPEPTTKKPEPTTKPPKEEPTTKSTAWTKINGKYYNDKGQVIEGAIKKGIDISKYQGKIDWAKVKKSDVSFVIIRCGYGDNILMQDDPYFKANVEACEKYNIPYGIYLYSYAQNKKMAKSEVQHVLRLLKEAKAKPTYPIYLDMEDATQWKLSNKELGDIASYFCNTLIKKGYKVGVYANLNWWNNKLTDKRFNQWNRWVAQYNSYCRYDGLYQMWQYTSVGSVSGIKGNVDMNFLYRTACSKGHKSKWVATKKATVLKTGTKKYICQRCGQVTKIKTISKLRPTGKLNKKSISIKIKNKYKNLVVKNLARGDSIKSYKSSNKKIAKVNKKGVITAGKKKGKAVINVTLVSGKVLKLKVKVKK